MEKELQVRLRVSCERKKERESCFVKLAGPFVSDSSCVMGRFCARWVPKLDPGVCALLTQGMPLLEPLVEEGGLLVFF